MRINIEQLKNVVERMENREKYGNMKHYGYVRIELLPNGEQQLIIEQPCHYYDCSSNTYTLREINN